MLVSLSDFHIQDASKKGTTLTMAITLSVVDRFTKHFHCCKVHQISNKTHVRLLTYGPAKNI